LERFSVVGFVWGPVQRTPGHDPTGWDLTGMLRGEEMAPPFVSVNAWTPNLCSHTEETI